MKSYTDLEQSRKLAEILPIESADMHYVRKTHDFMGNPVDGEWSLPKYGNPNSKHAKYIVQNFASYEKIPCWSVAALLSVLPMIKKCEDIANPFIAKTPDGEYYIVYATLTKEVYDSSMYDNPVDTCVAMIEKLNELKML